MVKKFLEAKHWQIFLITFGLPFILQIILMPISISSNDPTIIMKLFPIIMILFIGGIFGWYWSVAVGLKDFIPPSIKMKVSRFKLFLFLPLVYMLIMFGSIGLGIGIFLEQGQEPSSGTIASILGIIVPLHLFSMFCIFYCLYYVAKTIKTVELQREVSFSDFAGEFFMIWFFPIGIWIIQPKINVFISNNK